MQSAPEDTFASGLIRAATLWEMVERRAARTPDRLALLDEGDTRLTFGQLRERALRTAAGLHAEGIGPGSRVAWQLPTRVGTVLIQLALARLGAVQAPLLPAHRQHELLTLLPPFGTEYLIVPGTLRGVDHVALAAEVQARSGLSWRTLVIGPDGCEREVGAGGALPPAPVDGEEPRWAFATSGSTGTPKAAVHCDRSILTASYGFTLHTRLGEREDEVGSIPFPIAHVGGVQTIAVMLAGGFPSALLEVFTPRAAVALFRRHRVTTLCAGPVFYRFVLEEEARSAERLMPALRLFKGGGAPCPAALFWRGRRELDVTIAQDYGMTEAPMIAAARTYDPDDILAETDGNLIPDMELRVVDGGGRPCPAGQDGEIQIRGGAVTSGYTDPAHDATAFTADGWYRTGDLGHLRPGGYVVVTGRLKDIIIRKGENISAAEVEEKLLEVPGIAEVAVVGLPDEVRGELVCAVVRLVDPARPISLDQIGAHLRAAGLMALKLPERLEIVDDFPRTGLNKPAKTVLRARYAPVPGPDPV